MFKLKYFPLQNMQSLHNLTYDLSSALQKSNFVKVFHKLLDWASERLPAYNNGSSMCNWMFLLHGTRFGEDVCLETSSCQPLAISPWIVSLSLLLKISIKIVILFSICSAPPKPYKCDPIRVRPIIVRETLDLSIELSSSLFFTFYSHRII